MLTFSFFITKARSKEIRRMEMASVRKGWSIEGILGKEGMDRTGKLGMWV